MLADSLTNSVSDLVARGVRKAYVKNSPKKGLVRAG